MSTNGSFTHRMVLSGLQTITPSGTWSSSAAPSIAGVVSAGASGCVSSGRQMRMRPTPGSGSDDTR